MVIDVYKQYFEASCVFNGVERHAAVITLTSDSEAGNISYVAAASLFPFNDPEDFAVSYDAVVSAEMFSGKGRRSKKREAKLMENLQHTIDESAASIEGKVFWDKPLRPAQFG